jgi:hypothetical protein
MVYSGSECVDVLFWRKMYSTPLYLSLYPVKRRDDEAFWSQWQHVPERDGLLRLWEYASVINDENGALVGRVPVYTEADHELLAAWHARVSQAIVQRLKGEQAALDELAHDFQGEHPDPDNLRRITVLGRLLGRGVPSVLVEGLLDPAHDWGGLGRAFIWGDQGQGLPPSSGFSTHGCSGGGTHFTTFQVNMKFPGQEVLNEYSRERVIGLLGRLCREPLFRQDLLQREAHTESERARLERMVDELLTVRWLEERESRLTVDLPWLSWSVDADEQRLRGLAERTVEPVAAAAEELKTLAAQCSFARCRFGDVIYVILSKMRYFVVRDLQREGVIPPEPHPLPPGWGAWLYV